MKIFKANTHPTGLLDEHDGGAAKHLDSDTRLQSKKALSQLVQFAVILTVSILLVRLLSLGLYPLMDTTEARYAEMARIMLETGNWLTPMFDYDVPFWGKPPIFAWLSASGFSWFGINEWAARLPHFVVGLMTLLVVWLLLQKGQFFSLKQTKAYAWLTIAVMASTGVFILISGAVMTDTALLFAVTLAMSAFWMHYLKQGQVWGYLFFIALAVGMLAKGPIAIVLVLLSLSLWSIFERRWNPGLGNLPWKSGMLLFVLLAFPWYFLAEIATPGFMDYFILGEHFKRFVVTGWEGDLYGKAHDQPRGMIWLLWLQASLPWAPILILQIFRNRSGHMRGAELTDVAENVATPVSETYANSETNGKVSYLYFWLLSPLLIFSFAGNILWSYVLPGVPAMAILIAYYQSKRGLPIKVYYGFLVMPLLLMIWIFIVNTQFAEKRSDKWLMQAWKEQVEHRYVPLYYMGKRPFSAQFYSAGKAQKNSLSLNEFLSTRGKSFIVLSHKKQQQMKTLWEYGCELRVSLRKRSLYYCSGSKMEGGQF